MSAIEKCDCLNDCGDDDRLKTGAVKPCEHLKARQERAAEISRQLAIIERLRQVYGAANFFELIEIMSAKLTAYERLI